MESHHGVQNRSERAHTEPAIFMLRIKLALILGSVGLFVISMHWLGSRWTVASLELAVVGILIAFFMPHATPFGIESAEQGLRLSYGAVKSQNIIQHVRRWRGLIPYIGAFSTLAISTVVGLLSILLGSVIIAIVAVASIFFVAMAVFGFVSVYKRPMS